MAAKKTATAAIAKALSSLGMDKKLARAAAKAGSAGVVRHVLLRELWALVVSSSTSPDGKPAWMEGWLRAKPPKRRRKNAKPTPGEALARLLEAGADPEDLTTLVRGLQIDALFNLTFLLDGEPIDMAASLSSLDTRPSWTLVSRSDGEDDQPVRHLHESFHSYDPEGPDAAKRYTDR